MTEPWGGEERRTTLAEVKGLKESVLTLAEAVGQTMTRDEIIRGIRSIQILLWVNVVLNAVSVTVLVMRG